MGNSLVIISNTNLRFNEPEEIVDEILQRLDLFPFDWHTIYEQVDFKKKDYFRGQKPEWKILPLRQQGDDIYSGTWRVGEEGSIDIYADDGFSYSLFKFAADLNVHIGNGRYYTFLFLKKDPESTKWFDKERRIYRQMCHALGGDRVIYLGDQINEHAPAMDMMWNNKATFEEIEQYLLLNIGSPQVSMLDIYDDDDNHNARYFIDRFEGLD